MYQVVSLSFTISDELVVELTHSSNGKTISIFDFSPLL